MSKRSQTRKAQRKTDSADTQVKCIYCGIRNASEDEDVIARQFFPKLSQSDRILVPACSICNRGISKDEEYVRAVLLTMMDTDESPEAEEVRAKLLRSFQYKPGLVKRLHRSIQYVEVQTSGGIFLPSKVPVIGAEDPRLRRVFRKIVRGLYYLWHGSRLPDDHRVHVYMEGVGEAKLLSIPDAMTFVAQGEQYLVANGNVFAYWVRRGTTHPERTYWAFSFYRAVPILAATVPEGELEGAE